jgi:tetratricopeptide (TPR) repeat protein
MKNFSRSRIVLSFFSLLGIGMPLLADGLPGEYLLTQRWRDLLAGHTPLQNPAFLADENYPTIRGAFAPVLQGEFLLWELGYTQPIGLYQSVGLTWASEFDGYLPGSESVNGQLLPTQKSGMSNQNNYFMLSYAINPWSRLCLGANINIAHQTNFGSPKLGVGIDVGASYRLLRHPIFGDHTLGVFFQNALPPSMNDVDAFSVKNIGNSWYSSNLKASWLMKFWERRIELGMDADFKDLYSQAAEYAVSTGKTPIEFDFNTRVGFWILRFIKTYLQFGTNYWGLGGGINAPRANNGRDFIFMYQYMALTGGEATSHSAYTIVEVGKHREEVYARRMARMASVLPNDLYNRACRLYTAKKYWDAYFIFGQITAQFPDFFKNDWVEYYRGSCLEELDMRPLARETYEAMKRSFPRSDAGAFADLGIMRVDYRMDYNNGVRDQFGELNTAKTSDSLKYHAYYLMGETWMKEQDWVKANQIFSMIPAEHSEYIFAQHSMAITNIMLDRVEPALENFQNCLQAKAGTPQQQEVINRSALFLGYIYYEQNSLSKTITALRLVPKTSYYYTDALLGMGWTAIKARQWMDCAAAGAELGKVSDKPAVVIEGQLLSAYSVFMQKNYAAAATILKSAIDMLAEYKSPPIDSLGDRRRTYEQQRISYDFLSKEARKVSLLDPSTTVLRIIDSLAVEQLGTHKDLKNFMRFNDEFARREFFSRGIDQVRLDIEYAYAVVTKLVDKSQTIEIRQKTQEKQENIDAEIEKLKQEMQKIEGK